MTNEEWAVAGTAQGEIQAEILRGLLEAQGIPVMLSQEGAARVYGFGVGPMALVEILVPERYLEDAQTVLDEYAAGDFEVENGEEP